jgi:hypothetical protein
MQNQELRKRIQQDRHTNQHGELLESPSEQCSPALTIEENAQNVRRSPSPRIGYSGPYAEKNGHCRLQNESKTTGARQALGKVFQESVRKEIKAAMLIGIPQGKRRGGEQGQNDQDEHRVSNCQGAFQSRNISVPTTVRLHLPFIEQQGSPCELPLRELRLRFDFARPPRLVKPRFEWAVQTEDHEPTLLGDGLYPVVFFAGRSFWTEVNIHRSIRIHL